MAWVLSGVLVVASAGIAGYAGYLVWRLLRAEPAPGDGVIGDE